MSDGMNDYVRRKEEYAQRGAIQKTVAGQSAANVTPETIHPSHDVREEDTIGIASDPVCQKCRLAVYGESARKLLEPCVPLTPNAKSLLPAGTKLSCDMPNPFPGNRKEYPVFTGLLMYFPDACAAVARCSYIANEQHNPGQPVHWDKSKSVGEGNELLRHLMQGGTLDSDGIAHDVKAAWRALELVQRRIEAERSKG